MQLVRVKVKEIIEFIQDDDRLREERLKAKKNRDKYVGIDSDNMTISSSKSMGGFSSYSRSGFGNDISTKKSTMADLDDKEWRSSNPSIKERISDITSKVRTIIDQPPDNNHNLDISDGEHDLGIIDAPATNQNKFSAPKSKPDLKSNNSTIKKIESKQAAAVSL